MFDEDLLEMLTAVIPSWADSPPAGLQELAGRPVPPHPRFPTATSNRAGSPRWLAKKAAIPK